MPTWLLCHDVVFRLHLYVDIASINSDSLLTTLAVLFIKTFVQYFVLSAPMFIS